MSEIAGYASAKRDARSLRRRAELRKVQDTLPGTVSIDAATPMLLGMSTPRSEPAALTTYAAEADIRVWVSGYAHPHGGDIVRDPAAAVLAHVRAGGELAGWLADWDGHFAVVHADSAASRVTLATSRFGSVPLYVSADGPMVAWSTRFSALRHLTGVDATVSKVALERFLQVGFVPPEETYFRGVSSVPAATVQTHDLITGDVTSTRYWSWSQVELRDHDEIAAIAEFRELWSRAIARLSRFRPDAYLWLSGGFDSRLMLGELLAQGYSPAVFTEGEPGSREVLVAEHLARTHGLDVHVRHVVPELWLTNREQIVDRTDGVSSFVHQHITPFLDDVGRIGSAHFNGQWGDALLGSSLLPDESYVGRRADSDIRVARHGGGGTDPQDPFYDLPRFEPYVMDNRWRRFGAIGRAACSGASAELLPFLDGELVRFLIGLNPELRLDNRLYAAVALQAYPELFRDLPHAISGRTLAGTDVMPPWLQTGTPVFADYRAILGAEPVLGWARRLLEPRSSRLLAQVGQDFSKHLEITVAGGRNYREHVYRALTLEVWLRRHAEDPPRGLIPRQFNRALDRLSSLRSTPAVDTSG